MKLKSIPLVLLLPALMLLVACGSGVSESDIEATVQARLDDAVTPAPPTPTMTPPQVRELLANVALGFNDLPTGYALLEAGTYTANEELGKSSVLGQEVLLPKLEEWGRIMGYAISYERESTALVSTVEVYQTKTGAIESFEWLPPGYSSIEEYIAAELLADLEELAGAESLPDMDFSQISFPSLGDVSAAYKGSFGFDPLFFSCEVLGTLSGCIMVIPFGAGVASLQDLEAAARALDRKMKAVQ
jgi:hypothetical protein